MSSRRPRVSIRPFVVVRDAAWLDREAEAVTRLRRVAMGGDTTSDAARARLVRTHAAAPGARAVSLEVDDPSPDGSPGPPHLVGLAYGFPLRPGQWWRDTVSARLGAPASRRWLDPGFELAELHVLPAFQGDGLGPELLAALLADLHGTLVLSTPDRESRARALYRRLGFEDLARAVRFAGDPTAYALLGADLPLPLRARDRADP